MPYAVDRRHVWLALTLALTLGASLQTFAQEQVTQSADDDHEGDARAPTDEATDASPKDAQGLDPATEAAIERIVQARVDEALSHQERFGSIIEERMRALAESGVFQIGTDEVPVTLRLRGDFFTKFLVRNNASGGCVTYGNPAPEGDNFSGDNGICSELGLTIVGKVSDKVEAGARIQSRFGAQWATWWENGDLKDRIDGSGESLGLNHASYLQLRGIYLRAAPPIPTVRYFHVGASDLSMFNPWTIGKIRFTERDNARGVFIDGAFGSVLQYTLARVALPKLWASAGYNTGIDDPLVQNPFWERDAAWAYKLRSDWDWFSVEQITSLVIDEEADLDDPDAVGSTNAVDERDGVVVTSPRYLNANATLQLETSALSWLAVKTLVGYSFSRTNDETVFNSVSGAQGFSPVPMGTFHGYAAIARADVFDPLDIGVDLSFEYFNIGSDWVSVMGARREADVLLTDGFLDGQLPTLNIANEFQDFTEPFYESIIGWHGVTAVAKWAPWELELEGEATVIDYNTDTGTTPRDTESVYPDFLYTDGMTDTQLYSFANTNDRGRDPRSVYKQYQNRLTGIGVFKGAYTLDVLDGITFRAKHKTIVDRDQRNQRIEADDYLGLLFFNRLSVEAPVNDELSFALGGDLDYWVEQHRSGAVIAGVANYPDYNTLRAKAWLDLRYTWGGVSAWYHLEYLNKIVDTSDDRLDFAYRNIIRSLAMISASF